MNSMTGFGRAEIASKLGTLTVEVSSVNNRFLEFSIRMPRQLAPLEIRVREFLTEKLSRGQLNVNVLLDDSAVTTERSLLNDVAAQAYAKELKRLHKQLKLAGDVTVHDLVVLPDVLKPDKDRLDYQEAWKVLERALQKATVELLASRKKEGAAMAADMQARLASMRQTVARVEKQAAGSVDTYREKLKERIETLLTSEQRDSLRLEEEIALFAERTDITEECTRLKSHLDLYRDALKMKEPAGKRLNFILQEMNREANTIGSKGADFGVSTLSISLKEDIEKLRELVQNVE